MVAKLLAGLAAILMAGILSGCNSSPPPPSTEEVSAAVSRPFDAVADIKMGGISATADFNKTEEGVYSFSFTEPAALKGMVITMDAEKIGLSYLGLSLEADSEDVLDSAAAKAIVAAINKAAQPNGITVGTEGSSVTVSGETESGDFTLTLDPKNQSLLTLSIPNLDLECHFGG